MNKRQKKKKEKKILKDCDILINFLKSRRWMMFEEEEIKKILNKKEEK